MFNHNSEKRRQLKAGIILSLLMIFANEVGAVPANPLYPPDAVIYGKKMTEWSAEWYQYITSTPLNPNPLFDLSGGYCTLVQSGPVWFLEGTTGGSANRICSIPEGKALFFPLVNIANANVTNQTVNELRAEIAGCLNAAYNLSLTIDGQAIAARQLSRLRVLSVPFVAVYPPQGVPINPPLPPGIYSPAVSDGYYVMLKPMTVGHHTLHFTGASPGCHYAPTGFQSGGSWSVDVTYDLTIEPVSLD